MSELQRKGWMVGVGVMLIVAAVAVRPRVEQVGVPKEEPNWTEIEPGVWMGGRVKSPPAGVRAVLNLSLLKDEYGAEALGEGGVHRWEGIMDGEPIPSVEWLRRQVEFVEEQRQAGRTVYVHCDAGVSRSALVMTAYYMWKQGWTREEGLGFLKSRREVVRPNNGFMELLGEWEGVLEMTNDE